MSDLGTTQDVADTCRKIISRARQTPEVRERLNIWCFIPHYPYPPTDRRWSLGMQIGGSTYPGKFALIVHTTHAEPSRGGPHFGLNHWKDAHPDEDPQDYHFVLSNSCKDPIYRVMLWYNNPFHILTGWVEASVSNGGRAQGETKDGGGEHPMWLVTAKTRLVSDRNSWSGSGMIDNFFDYWLPLFVHEMRFLRWLTIWKEGSKGPWTESGVKWAQNMEFYESLGRPTVGTPVSKQHLKQLATEMGISAAHAKNGLLNMGYMETTTWTQAGIDWAHKMGLFSLLSPQPVVCPGESSGGAKSFAGASFASCRSESLSHPVTQAQLKVLAEKMHSTPDNMKAGMLSMGYAQAKELDLASAKKEAKKHAESKYQEVHSADGTSPPDCRIGRDLYIDEVTGNPTDVLSEMEAISQKEWCKCLCCTRFFMGFAQTAPGRAIRRHQQEQDLAFDGRGMPLLMQTTAQAGRSFASQSLNTLDDPSLMTAA